MDIFLDSYNSLQLLRGSLRRADYVLRPAPEIRFCGVDLSHTTLSRLQIPTLLDYLRIPNDGKLGLLVPSASERVRSRGIECRVCKHPRGKTPFYQLVSRDNRHVSLHVPLQTRVFVLSPEGIVLGMAGKLHRLVHSKRMSHQHAVLMLLKLCLELCGTYAHDPFDPHEGVVVYKTTPALSSEGLARYLSAPGNEVGLKLARSVMPLVYNNSGSPQESFLGPALFAERWLGGLALCEFRANEELELDYAQKQSIGFRTITPDFQLKGYNTVVEYNGAVHEEGDNPQIDHTRMLDYQTLSKRAFVFQYTDVKTQEDFMKNAARIVRAMGWEGNTSVAGRFARMQKSVEFKRNQQVLFEVFRPWLR